LGITHVYASPYLKARPGSSHGYDIVDHQLLNPEIGTDEEYALWVKALQDHDMGQILDMVPNHMGIVGNENRWWNDVLENGPASPYSTYFDIGWHSSPRPELMGRVLIPILAEPYGKALESGRLQLAYHNGTFFIQYLEHHFPIDPRTYEIVLCHPLEDMQRLLPTEDPALAEYQSIITAVRHLPSQSECSPDKIAERQREKEVIKRRLQALLQDTPTLADYLHRTVSEFNGLPGTPESYDLLSALLDSQAYRLSFWRVASDEVNYRRFFDVNELAALSMEREDVFRDTHELVMRLLAEDALQGLRIDHVDGLYDPQKYLERLQQRYCLSVAKSLVESDPGLQTLQWEGIEDTLKEQIAEALREGTNGTLWRSLYIVVEKILGPGEALPEDWSIHGTSGYDFLNQIGGLFHNGTNAPEFGRIYEEWVGDDTAFSQLAYQKKGLVLHAALASELHMLAFQLDRIAQKKRWSRDFTLNTLRRALREIIACLPIYRTYINDAAVREADCRYVEMAVRKATTSNPTMSRYAFEFIRDALLHRFSDSNNGLDAELRHFAGKFQQVSSPVMAKGVEDTAFYVYNRLLSLNEVGGNPDQFGLSPEVVHGYLQDRQAKWPYALSPLSTHDTKRSEDARARISLLSEMPADWGAALQRWAQMNDPLRSRLDGDSVPDRNEECFLYQTLIGAWPLEPYSKEEYGSFVDRIQAYIFKALHEAKVHTSWVNPDTEYSEAVHNFVTRILDERGNPAFLKDFRAFQARVSAMAMLTSLAQTLLRLTSPGVPDTYQGTEFWDFSLVDPDNRRSVNYESRRQILSDLKARMAANPRDLVRELMEAKNDGRIKLFVTWLGLQCRRRHRGLFSTGTYTPIEATGAKRDHVFSFVRQSQDQLALVAVPRLVLGLGCDGSSLETKDFWQDTALQLHAIGSPHCLQNIFTGQRLCLTGNGTQALPLSTLFAEFPVALLATS
jgi:(1->4)-alpha-D-glucan 1-alpha-D-glucosylmutase